MPQIKKTKKEYKLTWMGKRSLKEMVRIEREGDNEWSRQDFIDFHGTEGNLIIVLEDAISAVGFIAVRVEDSQVEIVKLGVHKGSKRDEYREKLISYIKKSSFKSKSKLFIKFVIRETDVDLREYLVSQGFCATKLLINYFGNLDGYLFRCCNT